MKPVKSRSANVLMVPESRTRRVGRLKSVSSKRRWSDGSLVKAILNAPLRITLALRSAKLAFAVSLGLSSPGLIPAELYKSPRKVGGRADRMNECWRIFWSLDQALKYGTLMQGSSGPRIVRCFLGSSNKMLRTSSKIHLTWSDSRSENSFQCLLTQFWSTEAIVRGSASFKM